MLKKIWIVIAIALVMALTVTAITVSAANERATLNISVVTKNAENDLVKTLNSNYNGIKVYSTLDGALDAAEENGTVGIMVLADKYPNTTVAVTDDEAARINELGIRVYVEYPANNEALGIEGYNGTKAMGYDRAIVIDSAATGMDMYSLLYVHGAQHLMKTDISDSWVATAKVAGYDKVEFYDEQTGELTDCTPYSLIELSDSGRVLIASTKLSQFIGGKYAPYARWQSLWMSVISWVAGVDVGSINKVEWTPLVNPNYGPEEELADNAYSEAVRLNTEWFIKSGLLVEPDGSEGIMEGYRSGAGFKVDGDQRVRNSVRADCNGETIAALALAAELLGNDEYKTIAYNMMDWLLNESELANGVRADEENDQYGLLSWHYGALDDYYGDDNARAILGLIIAASSLETDEFDERILEAIIANFRTTGVNGYRGGMLSAEKIDENGWEYYYNRSNKNFAPHFESMLWACYLWAYDKTGYEPLLDRTRTGISMMMDAYDETMKGDLDSGSGEWKSTNGIQQERAKMILPLAWLVRIEPTEEHIGWLDLMVNDLMAYQDDATGALRDAVADEGYGIIGLPPFSKNSDYGGAEAAVIQNNGDPCSDSLYTANFAMLGLNEAYAAMKSIGNTSLADKYERYTVSLCDYHVRIQQVSENSKYNGIWYRGFDYEKWEAYGSDGDAGWGIWCVETGWTQAWISATLSMQTMQTNIWDYSEDSNIDAAFDTVAERMLAIKIEPGVPVATYELSENVGATGVTTVLFDAEYGTTTYNDGKWFGAQGVDITLFIDYQDIVSFDTIKVHFLQDMSKGICVPAGISVYTSDDGITYTLFGSAVGTEDIQTEYSNRRTDGAFFEYLTVSSSAKKSARYVKIVVENAGEYVSYGNSTKHWIFMDEVETLGGEVDMDALQALVSSVATLDTLDCQPATVMALEAAYKAAVKYCGLQNPAPEKYQGIYDDLHNAISGLKKNEAYTATGYSDNFNRLRGELTKLTDGIINKSTLEGKVITNLSTLDEQELEVFLDLGSSVAVYAIGYSADSTPTSGKYMQNAEFFVSDSPDGPWVSVGTVTGKSHVGEASVTQYLTSSAAANGTAGRYVKVVFTRNEDVEISVNGKVKRAEWLYLTEIYINEYVPVTVESEKATVTVKDSLGKELSMLGARVGDVLTVEVAPNSDSMISGVLVNGVEVTLVDGKFVIDGAVGEQTIKVNCFSFSEADRPTIVVKDWFISPGEAFDPLADIYAYDKNGKDISSSVTVKSNSVGATTGTYTVTYYVADEAGAFVEATANVYAMENLSAMHVVAITPSTKDDLSKMAQRLVDGTYAPAGSTHAASQYVSWLDNDYIEIVIALGGNIGVADVGYSLISCPTYGFLPPDIDIYAASTLGEWTKIATVEAVKHPFGNKEYEYIKKYVALDNVKASYVKLVIRFDDNSELLEGYKPYVPGWTFVDEIMINPYYKVEASTNEGGSVDVATQNTKGALWGESATLTILPNDGYIVDSVTVNGVKVDVKGGSYTINGITKHYAIDVKFARISIESVSIKLTDSISLLYTAILDSSDGTEMRFVMNGKEAVVSGIECGKNRYVFEFKNVSPQCMLDNVYAELKVGGETVDVLESYSIRAYGDSMLKKIENKAIDGYTDPQYAALKQLIIDMLAYGAAAQNYKDYNTDSLANAGVDGATVFEELSEEHEIVFSGSESESAHLSACGVRFDYINSIYVKLKLDGIDISRVTVLVKAKDGSVENAYAADDLIDLGNGEFKVYTDGIKPTEFDKRFEITLLVDGDAVQTIEYSISAYVYYIQNETEGDVLTDMAALARAMYLYGRSATEYAKLN